MKTLMFGLGVIAILILIVWLVYRPENFTVAGVQNGNFVVVADAQMKGMNMLGVNSLDTFIPASSPEECQQWCESEEGCKGFSYYWPGQRCIINSSGGLVYNRPGFISGLKF